MTKEKKSKKEKKEAKQHKKKKKSKSSRKEKQDRTSESIVNTLDLESDDKWDFDPVRDWQPVFDSFYDPVMAGNADGGLAAGPHDRAIRRAILSQARYRPASLVPLHPSQMNEDGELDEESAREADSAACTVFVGRLDPSVEEADLRSLFDSCGRIVSCRLVCDWATGHSRRYGFVQFDRPSDAQRAVRRCDGLKLLGQPILVDRERSLSQPGWVPRRLGGGLGGRKESGQLRFGCRARPFRRPAPVTEAASARVGSYKD